MLTASLIGWARPQNDPWTWVIEHCTDFKKSWTKKLFIDDHEKTSIVVPYKSYTMQKTTTRAKGSPQLWKYYGKMVNPNFSAQNTM